MNSPVGESDQLGVWTPGGVWRPSLAFVCVYLLSFAVFVGWLQPRISTRTTLLESFDAAAVVVLIAYGRVAAIKNPRLRRIWIAVAYSAPAGVVAAFLTMAALALADPPTS